MSNTPQLPKLVEKGRPTPAARVPYSPHNSSQRRPSVLDKAAQYVNADPDMKSHAAKSNPRVKSAKRGMRMPKALGKMIVGPKYSGGMKK